MTSASMGQVSPGGSGLGKSQEVSALPSLITICVALAGLAHGQLATDGCTELDDDVVAQLTAHG